MPDDAQYIDGDPDELVLEALTPKSDAGGCDDEIEILRKGSDGLAKVQGYPNIKGFSAYVCQAAVTDVRSHAIQK